MVRAVPEQWENIGDFFGAYLNQDFADDYGSPWETVTAYKALEPREVVLQAADEAEELARSSDDEEELRSTLLDFGLGYMLWADGWNCRDFLEHLAEMLRAQYG